MPKATAASQVPVYLERGVKRTFACAVDWPGWCRSGRDEATALQALFASAPRYARAIARARLGFRAPSDVGSFRVVGRYPGDATTDFGAPGVSPRQDEAPLDDAGLERLRTLVEAGWRAFDAAVVAARGKTLTKGPRGGGRELDAIVRHVREAETGYLGALGWRFHAETGDERGELERTRKAVIDGLAASARGEIVETGPRGGRRWKARFFARRLAWHTLDHLWEIEDRVAGPAEPAAPVSRSRAPKRSTRGSAPAPRSRTRSRARR